MSVNPFDVLRAWFRFRKERANASRAVEQARQTAGKAEWAGALRTLGELERRTPLTRAAALKHYEESVALFREVDDPLTLAHTIRHLGLVHEDAGRLPEAEKYYDEALAIYRKHDGDTLNYANAVRYPAAIKDRLGKRDESAVLWEEAYGRYEGVGVAAGSAEAAGRLTLFALDRGDAEVAREWFAKANTAAEASGDPTTREFISQISARFE